jgi:hypothetical protein
MGHGNHQLFTALAHGCRMRFAGIGKLRKARGEINPAPQGEGRLLFVNKKKQKNFVILGPCGFSASGPVSRTFSRRFFQKAAAFLGLSKQVKL